jgi:hypothetical protein
VISRVGWLVAGAAVGVYASVKGRRAAYRLSVPGVLDQAAALGAGWRELRAEISTGMAAREADLTSQLGHTPLEPDHQKDHPTP